MVDLIRLPKLYPGEEWTLLKSPAYSLGSPVP